jgi:hypothetical protein
MKVIHVVKVLVIQGELATADGRKKCALKAGEGFK